LTVSFLVRMENVTDQVFSKLKGNINEASRIEKINEIVDKIEAKAIGKTHYTAEVKSFCNDMEFYLFVYEIFLDVRLTGAPPISIGKFGGDRDNWMWPRHCGDFALFRIYTGPDGKPAQYSDKNIPFEPRYHLPVSLDGIAENDFAMTLGYPIKTDRYLYSNGVDLKIKKTNPALKKLKDKRLKILLVSMDENDEIKLLYTTKYTQASNYSKFYLGQSKQLKRFKVYEKKKELEKDFQEWVNADSDRNLIYGNILHDIDEAYKQIEKYNMFKQYFTEVICNGSDLTILVNEFYPVYQELNSQSKRNRKTYQVPEDLKETVRDYVRNVDFETDKKIFKELFELFYYDVDSSTKQQHPAMFSLMPTEYSYNFDWFTNTLYNKTLFTNYELLWNFINNPNLNVLENDFAFKLLLSCKAKEKEIDDILKESHLQLNRANRLFNKGLREMNPGKKYYCDANSSMRLSYGTVLGCEPMDGTVNEYYTTLSGVMEKQDPDDPEFIIPEKLAELYQNKDYGNYSDNGQMNVCFLTNNDVSSGSAGSPVINGNGQMIGIVFDLNWEGMSGDISYEADVYRAINVDMRYVLFVIDKLAGAKHLVDEMTVIHKSSL
ncbi:MAG: S46 family peptidase, partial [Bacteroidales bacterium]|nr:S46 family peptidase [Bacteroidales bacterium]